MLDNLNKFNKKRKLHSQIKAFIESNFMFQKEFMRILKNLEEIKKINKEFLAKEKLKESKMCF